MAFISGYTTEYRCKLCRDKVERVLHASGGIGMLGYSFKHIATGIIMINGYPSACPKNGKTLEGDMIEKIEIPIIHTAGSGFY